MRPSPRLSLFAAACATVMMISLSATASDTTYDMSVTGNSTASGASAVAGWEFNSIGVSSGHANFNAGGDSMVLTNSFTTPITNVVVYYKASSGDATRILNLDGYNKTTYDGPGPRDFSISTSANTLAEFPFDPSDAVDCIEITLGSGGKGTWIVYSVTVQTVDPPPTIDPISDRQANVAEDLVVHFHTTSFDNDQLTFSATAENLDDPTATYSDDSFLFDHNYSMMIPGYWDFTFHTPYYSPSGFEPCRIRFTITATGAGGSTNLSFVCTFTEETVPTPPEVWTPTYNPAFVLAGRMITIQVGYREADGDQVRFTVTNNTCNGTYAIGESTGLFTFTPTLLDVAGLLHEFTVRAEDKDGYNEATIRVVVFPVRPPVLTPVGDRTIAFGDSLVINLEADATEYDQTLGEYGEDPLISSNITVKAGTTAPEGECTFYGEEGYLYFEPAAADIGKIFTFLATATDFDGTSSNEFTVTVGLAKPVLKHCPVDDWTATSFKADIQAAVPGAATYNLRHIHHENDGTPVTNIVPVSSFPHEVSGLATTNYVYDVQAVCGAATSQWSNAKSIDLHAYIAPTYAIPMTGAAHGSHTENFNCLISSGSAYWYDARTIPGWYAASSSGSMSDVEYSANDGGSSGTGLFSCKVDDFAVTNRALAVKADTQWDDFSFGVIFTNQCKYAVTNITVSFTAMQFRRYQTISHLYFSYTRSNRLIDYNAPENIWTSVGTLDFSAPTQGASARIYPPTAASRTADIPFVGGNALQPGEVIAMRWYLDAKSNYPTLGIDDLTVSWECAWPRHTVFSVR